MILVSLSCSHECSSHFNTFPTSPRPAPCHQTPPRLPLSRRNRQRRLAPINNQRVRSSLQEQLIYCLLFSLSRASLRCPWSTKYNEHSMEHKANDYLEREIHILSTLYVGPGLYYNEAQSKHYALGGDHIPDVIFTYMLSTAFFSTSNR
jgi:hypothetical protein